MARSPARGDLFINIGGDVTPLSNAVKAGKSVLNELVAGAVDIRKEVEKQFANMGASAPAEAKKIEQSFSKSFSEIRRNADAVIKAGNGGGALQILDAAAARDGAAAADLAAKELRSLADAAVRADKAAGGTNAGVRVLAVTTEVAAQEAAQYATAMRTQAAAFSSVEAQMVGTTNGQRRLSTMTGQTRAGMQQLGFQLNDVAVQFAAGTPPAVIFSQQIGQATQAVQLMSGGTSKAAAFLGGPWGIAIGVAVSVLVPLIAKIMEGTDEVGKLVDKKKEDARQSYLNAEADRQWKTTIEGVTEAIKKRREEQERERKSEPTVVQENIAGSKTDLQNALTARKNTLRDIKTLEKEIADYRRATGQPAGSEYAETRLKSLRDDLAKYQAQIDAANTSIRASERIAIERAVDPTTKSVDQLEIELDQLQATFDAGGIADGDYAKKFGVLTKAIEKAKDAARDLKKETSTNLPNVTGSEISSALGTKITSGYRSPEHNRSVGGAANSYHLGNSKAAVQAIDVPINLMIDGKLATTDAIRKKLEPLGIEIKELLGRRPDGSFDAKHDDHFHIAFAKKRLGPDQVDKANERAENAAQKAADKRQNQDDNYAAKRQALDDREFEARNALIKGVDEQVRVQTEQVDRALARYEQSLDNDVHDGRLRKEQAKELKAKAEAVAIQDKANIDAKAREEANAKSLRDLDEQLAQTAQFKIDDKQFQEEQARSNAERLDLQNQIIDLVYEERKRHLEYLKHQAELNGEVAEAARIQAEINNLPSAKARDQKRAANDNKSPMDRYFDSLPHSLAEINDQLEEIQARSLKALEESLGRATAKALGLKGALGDLVAQLVQLGFQTLMSSLSGNFKFGGGKAIGGGVNDNEWYIVGEKGPELFFPGRNGTIIPNHVVAQAALPQIPRSLMGGSPVGHGSGRSAGRPNVFYNIHAKDVDSFRRSDRQLMRDENRKYGRR